MSAGGTRGWTARRLEREMALYVFPQRRFQEIQVIVFRGSPAVSYHEMAIYGGQANAIGHEV